MLRYSVKKPTLGVAALFVAAFFFMLAGCDMTGSDQSDGSDGEDYEVTDDLDDRVTTDDKSAKGAFSIPHPKSSQVSFHLLAQVDPPTVSGTGARATTLSFDGNDNLYIGYLLLGTSYGGGIDILDAQDPTNIGGATSLQSENTDVQALTSGQDGNEIYVAEAVPPTVDADANTPSRVSVLELQDGAVSQVSRRLSGNVAKSVAVAPDDDDAEQDFHAITDKNSLYGFDRNLSDETMRHEKIDEDVDFMGLATNGDNVFVLGRDGQIYYSNDDEGASLQKGAVNLESGIEKLGIARLSAYDEDAGENIDDGHVFAALGHNGFAVLDGDGNEVQYRQTETGTFENADGNEEEGYYTSVTFHGNVPASGGDDYVYGARRWGMIDVFKVPDDGISENGLDLVRRLYLREVFDLGQADDIPPSVNYVLGVKDSDVLYVSGGKAGTLVLELGASGDNPKAISFAAFCTTQDNYDEKDVTITDTEEKEPGEVIRINWESDTELSTVVLKAGPGMYNYPGGTSNEALVGAGDPPGVHQKPPKPCPKGEDLIVKNEDV